MKNMRIRTKLLILVLVAFIPMLGLNFYMILHQRNQVIERELQSNQEYATAISTAYMNYINKIWHTEFSIGQFLIRDQLKNSKMQEYLFQCASDENVVSNYLWVSPEGKVIASSNPKQIGMILKDSDYYKDIINGKEKVVSDLLYEKLSTTFAIAIERGIWVNGELEGIVMAEIDAQAIESIMPERRLSKTSSFGLVDKNGMIVYRNGTKNIPIEKRKINKDSPIWNALQGKIATVGDYNASLDGSSRIGVDYPISPIGWAVFATITTDEVFASFSNELRLKVIITLITALISLMIVLIFVFDLLKPIKELQNAANEIASTDFSVRVNMNRKDELGQTAIAFNKMAESIEQYNKLKTEFFSNMSHEFRTPLNVIYSTSQLVSLKYRDDKVDKEVSKYTQIINQNCFRLLRLINNLIDITKYDSGFLIINLINFNIINLVEEITMSIVQYAEGRGIEVIFDTELEEDVIACDPDFIERIILNLLSNSIKSINKNGSIFVNVYKEKEYISISIKDSGVGIPADKLETIFERFRQVDSSLSRKNEGSGIGLSLVKALVEAHKGTISAKSKVGEGSEFIVKLPEITISEENGDESKCMISSCSLVERVDVEFSDIYNN